MSSRSACRSTRRVRLTLYRGHGRVRRASVTMNGEHVKAARNGRSALLDMRGYRSGIARVNVNLRLDDGRTVRFAKRFVTCVPQRDSGK